jgi:excisionase family DNA binding protein
MNKADKNILTTAETAKLLGVSVRTAQLLIEGGSVPSWKTPGGHRRVYRRDIEAIVDGHAAPAPASVRVTVVAPSVRMAAYTALFDTAAECAATVFDDPFAALLVIGGAPPHAVIVDLTDGDAARRALLESLAKNGAVGGSRFLAVGDSLTSATPGHPRIVRVERPEDALDAIRGAVADAAPAGPPAGDLAFPLALNEGQRLVALERLGLLDTAPEEAFDRLTWLAARTLDAPISLVTLLTPTRQWFKSRFGLDLPETPRSWAFCNHTILQKGVFSVDDLAGDPRFANNPAVAGDPGFRFYAGAPILDGDGHAVGSLCVIDYKPRSLDPDQCEALKALAALASAEVRLRSTARELREVRTGSERSRPARDRRG